tara:strand:+ start:5040 stop:5264 length:225 start_codon:yes stop_codon:yes gene_type:complete
LYAAYQSPKFLKYGDMVKGLGLGCWQGRRDGARVDVDLAVWRIEENFVYVGITERFHDTVMDFHKLAGDPYQVP